MGMSNAERQRRWREHHPEAAAQAARESRARKTAGMVRRRVRVVVELTPGEAAMLKEHLADDLKEYPAHATLEDVARAQLLGTVLWAKDVPEDLQSGGDHEAYKALVKPLTEVLDDSCHARCECPEPDTLLNPDAQLGEVPCLWRECAAAGKARRNVWSHDLSTGIKGWWRSPFL